MRRNLVNVFDLRELTDLIASCSLSETLLHIYRIFKCGCGKCNKLQDTGATGRMIYILPRAETDSAKWQKARKAKLIAALNGIERTCKDNQAQKGSQPRSQCSQTAAIFSFSVPLSLTLSHYLHLSSSCLAHKVQIEEHMASTKAAAKWTLTTCRILCNSLPFDTLCTWRKTSATSV